MRMNEVAQWRPSVAQWLICPCRGRGISPKCIPGRGTVSPSVTQGILRLSCPLLGFPSCPGALPPAHYTPANGADLQNLRISAPLFAKTRNIYLLTIPKSMVLRECFSCTILTRCSLSPSLSLLRQKGLPPLCGTVVLLSSKSSLCTAYLPHSLLQIMQIILLIFRAIA